MYLDRLRELFSGVDWSSFEESVNSLYILEGRGRRPKPPIAYTVRPANENEKRCFKTLALKAKKSFPNARWHIADGQYSSKKLRKFVKESLKGRPVIAKRENEGRGGEDFYVDRLFRCHGNPEMCRLYKRRTASTTSFRNSLTLGLLSSSIMFKPPHGFA